MLAAPAESSAAASTIRCALVGVVRSASGTTASVASATPVAAAICAAVGRRSAPRRVPSTVAAVAAVAARPPAPSGRGRSSRCAVAAERHACCHCVPRGWGCIAISRHYALRRHTDSRDDASAVCRRGPRKRPLCDGTLYKVKPVGVLYEHPQWFAPLFAELDRRGVPFEAIHAAHHRFDPAAAESPYSLVVNRMSPSAWTRGHAGAIFHSLHYLAWLDRIGANVLNGYDAYRVELSKAAQSALFTSLGVRHPRTRVVNSA